MKSIILFVSIIISVTINAQDFDRQKMDSLFSLIESNSKGMGSISIFKDGKEVYQKSIGYADVKKNIKAKENTKYRIGSISKVFTATIIMKLVEEGKLTLDTKLSDFFPDVKNSNDITIEMLLRHRSGIFNFTSSEDYKSWMEKPISREELIQKIAGYDSSFEPDEKAEYSNSNFVLLSFIAEKTDGKDYSQILTDRITRPCSLTNTKYGSKISVKKNESLSYIRMNDWELATETNMSIPTGAGAIISTPVDLNKFLYCLFIGELVGEESLKKMIKLEDGFGMGLFRVPFYDRQAYGHNGGIDGFQSNSFYFIDEGVSIAYLSNAVVMPVNDIIIGVLSIYFGREYTLPDFIEAIQLNKEELEKYTGVYSTPDLPLDITITINGNTLTGQGTGQPSFPLEAYDTDKFRFEPGGLTLEFIPEENKMILRQGGGQFEFNRSVD